MTINASDLLPVRTASCSVMGDYAIKKKMTVPYSKAKRVMLSCMTLTAMAHRIIQASSTRSAVARSM